MLYFLTLSLELVSMEDNVKLNTVYILLGGNLGNRERTLKKAVDYICDEIGSLSCLSALYETEAWGYKDQPAFLNQVVCVHTLISPTEVLTKCLDIERRLGRHRFEKWHERTIDLDIIYYNSDIINLDILSVPHPLLHERNFTLVPLAEIAPDFIHPTLHRTNSQLLNYSPDQSQVNLYKPER